MMPKYARSLNSTLLPHGNAILPVFLSVSKWHSQEIHSEKLQLPPSLLSLPAHFNLCLLSERLCECDPALQTGLLSFPEIEVLIKTHAVCPAGALQAEPKWEKLKTASKKRKTILHGSFRSIKLIIFIRNKTFLFQPG